MSYDILFIDITELNAYISINLNKPMEKRMNRHLQEDYEYHQNAKWDHIQQLTKEHHDPFAGEEMTEKEIKELIEQAKKDKEVA